MTLRRKTLLTIFLTLLALYLFIYGAFRVIIMDSFTRFEERDTRDNVERVLNALKEDLRQLDTTVGDYAGWDDTYRFVQDGNSAYIKANFIDTTFAKLRLNVLFCLNNEGRIVYAKGFDLDRQLATPVPAHLITAIRTQNILLIHENTESRHTGILMLPEGPIMVASRPIITSEYKGPIKGTFIMGRNLNGKEVQRLAEMTRLTLSSHIFNGPSLPSDVRAVQAKLSRNKRVLVQPRDEKIISGFALIPDLNDKPALILRADLFRGIHQQAHRSLFYVTASLLLIALVFTSVVLILLERTVLARLSRLADTVRVISHTRNENQRIHLNGSDELSELGETINRMLDELQHSHRKVMQSEERYHRLFDDALTGNFVATPDCHIILCNEAFARIMGFASVAEVLATDMVPFFPDGQQREEFIHLLKAEKTLRQTDTELTNRTGAVLTTIGNFTSLFDEEGNLQLIQGYIFDISERKKAEQEISNLNKNLSRQAEELAQVNSELEAFSYSVSHDLRSPLTRINGFSQLLHEENALNLTPEGRFFFERIRVATEQMGQIIDGLLKLSRISRDVIQCQEIDLSTMAATTAAELQITDPERQVTFTIEPGMHAWGDQALIRLVMQNLMDNAWKYSARNPQATIEVGTTDSELDPTYFVRDNGAGFDMRYISKLFAPFNRLHTHEEFTGFGIGLATVQRIINRHGGRIWAESAVELGTTFFFTLPRGSKE